MGDFPSCACGNDRADQKDRFPLRTMGVPCARPIGQPSWVFPTELLATHFRRRDVCQYPSHTCGETCFQMIIPGSFFESVIHKDAAFVCLPISTTFFFSFSRCAIAMPPNLTPPPPPLLQRLAPFEWREMRTGCIGKKLELLPPSLQEFDTLLKSLVFSSFFASCTPSVPLPNFYLT